VHGLVTAEDGHYAGGSTVAWLTAVELAHPWWTAVVGNDQINKPCLDGAPTQFSTMLCYEAAYGRDRANTIRNAVFDQAFLA